MNKAEKIQFIKELTTTIANRTINDVEKMPDDWNGFQLRWLLAERFNNASMSKTENRRLYWEYVNTTITNNL